MLYLVSSDVMLDYERLTTIYQKRWKVEEYHKSLKSNASLAKSPTKTVRTQSNHFFVCIYAFVKLERMKIVTKTNHFALRVRASISKRSRPPTKSFRNWHRSNNQRYALRKVSDYVYGTSQGRRQLGDGSIFMASGWPGKGHSALLKKSVPDPSIVQNRIKTPPHQD